MSKHIYKILHCYELKGGGTNLPNAKAGTGVARDLMRVDPKPRSKWAYVIDAIFGGFERPN